MSSSRPGRAAEPGSGSAERPPRGDSATANLSQITLRPLAPDDALALLSGRGKPVPGLRWHREYPLAETLDAISRLVAAYGEVGDAERSGDWGLHQIVRDGVVVGDVGFAGPPPEAGPVEVEIGYAVVPALRGRGIATRACGLILAEAWRAGAVRVLAETEPDNVASRHVLQACGFTGLGYGRYVIERPGAELP